MRAALYPDGPKVSRLSRKQREALDYIERANPVSPARLAVHLNTSPEGAAATASSLVRRGLARRVRYRGSVHYVPSESADA